jgi:hypothetical protein
MSSGALRLWSERYERSTDKTARDGDARCKQRESMIQEAKDVEVRKLMADDTRKRRMKNEE